MSAGALFFLVICKLRLLQPLLLRQQLLLFTFRFPSLKCFRDLFKLFVRICISLFGVHYLIERRNLRVFLLSSLQSLLLFQTLSYFLLLEDVKAGSKSSLLMMDPQKKLNMVDESFIDQKDVLLDMVR